jgi:hypothetical protein
MPFAEKAKDHASPSLLHSIRAPSFLGLSPGSTLAPLAGGSQPPFVPLSGGLAVRTANRSAKAPLIAASVQPFSSRLFFLCLRTNPTRRKSDKMNVGAINPKNKKGRKFKFQADKKARVYKRLVPHRPCFFASFHLMYSFLFFPFFFWKNNMS